MAAEKHVRLLAQDHQLGAWSVVGYHTSMRRLQTNLVPRGPGTQPRSQSRRKDGIEYQASRCSSLQLSVVGNCSLWPVLMQECGVLHDWLLCADERILKSAESMNDERDWRVLRDEMLHTISEFVC